MDGVGVETMEAVMSEYGPTLDKFPNEKALVKHLRLAPRQNISGGKASKSRRGRKSTTRVGELLRMAAAPVERTATEPGAYFRPIAHRNGPLRSSYSRDVRRYY